MNNLTLRIVLLAILANTFVFLYAQNDKDLGTWAITNVEYEFAKNFVGYFELQTRTQKPFQKIFYSEVKGGVAYRINKNFSTLIGFGNYRTYDWKDLDAGVKTNELRIWEQFVISQPLNRLKFEHRFRAEQAWLNKKYRNRFRYRISLIIPLNKSKIEKNTAFISLFDEIFMTNTAPFFMRNRAYAGVGYQATSFLTVQVGYVHQFNYTLSSEVGKHNLLFSINFRFLRKDNKDERIPTKRD